MNWLFGERQFIYLRNGTAVAILAAVWYQRRERKYAIALGVAVGLACVYGLLDFTRKETDAEQIQRKLKELTGFVHAQQWDRLWDHVSDDFRVGGMDKKGFRSRVDSARQRYDVHEVEIWDIDMGEVSRAQRTGKISFKVKVKGNFHSEAVTGAEHWLCRAVFALDKDDQWRLQSFELFNPYVETKTPLGLPF